MWQGGSITLRYGSNQQKIVLKNLSSGKDLLDGHSDLGPDSIPGDQGDCSHIAGKFRIFKEYYNNTTKCARGGMGEL